MADLSAYTLAELHARRRALKDLILSGSMELRFGDRWEKFDSYEGKAKALAMCESEIVAAEAAAGTTTKPVRRVRVYQDSDFD